jgi:hypothetical protein
LNKREEDRDSYREDLIIFEKQAQDSAPSNLHIMILVEYRSRVMKEARIRAELDSFMSVKLVQVSKADSIPGMGDISVLALMSDTLLRFGKALIFQSCTALTNVSWSIRVFNERNHG